MIEGRRQLFRPVAFERYVRGRDRVVLPRYIRPGALTYLWAVLGLVLGAATLAAATPIPERVPGTAIILAPTGDGLSPTRVVVLIPARYAAEVQPGQTVALRTGRDQLLTATIDGVSGESLSPSEARQRIGLGADANAASLESSVLAEARLELPSGDAPTADLSPGQLIQAQVQIGTRPVWALLSPFGQSGEE